jgi:hypothetical protein
MSHETQHESPRAPCTLAGWQAQIPGLRTKLWGLLGDLPPAFTPQADVLWTAARGDYTIEKIAFDNGTGAQVTGFLLLPSALSDPVPAVLYNHFHGFQYDLGKNEILLDHGIHQAPGVALARAGCAVLAIDAYGFGERQHQGPMKEAESGPATELSLFKKFLWEGRTLWGMMLRDDQLALNYLLSRPEVDSTRVGVTGMSMGGSRATWLAALDERVQVVVPIAQMTRYRDFAEAGNLGLHGIYYYVPGMLASGIDMEILVSLAAPRRQHILIGEADPLSPIKGVRTVDEFASGVYALFDAPEQFRTTVFPGIGHEYTPDMFRLMLEEFQNHFWQR